MGLMTTRLTVIFPVEQNGLVFALGCDYIILFIHYLGEFRMNTYFIDGQFITADKGGVPYDDLGVLRGYGVFDFLRTYNQRPFYLTAHLERLIRSAGQIEIELPWTLAELEEIVIQTLQKNPAEESNIRILVTGGSSMDSISPDGKPRLMVMVTPVFVAPKWWYSDGVKVITTAYERFLPTAKTINYIPAIMALKTAYEADAIEAIYLNSSDHVLEGTTSNLFAVIDDHIVTPKSGVLSGITRQVTIQISQPLYHVEMRDITRDELLQAQEVFLTSSNKEVAPVVQVDDHVIADGKPGAHTRQIIKAFAEYTAQYGSGEQ